MRPGTTASWPGRREELAGLCGKTASHAEGHTESDACLARFLYKFLCFLFAVFVCTSGSLVSVRTSPVTGTSSQFRPAVKYHGRAPVNFGPSLRPQLTYTK
ncbi:hypothetical protein CSUI_008900 [Cystoisospora suis]|uniref:Transmembrane protein n=1 Tax=Cystoisospora suis TaxID=483139 RepID=A0A2C6K6R7_9APIC|nr:hypothetical protein CSUI_008900 [Cystoisospora suis]